MLRNANEMSILVAEVPVKGGLIPSEPNNATDRSIIGESRDLLERDLFKERNAKILQRLSA